jgi:hypothetical protein
MTKNEKEEFKEFITMSLAGHSAKFESQFDIINIKLTNIEEQTKKTNGRVNKLEENYNSVMLAQKDFATNKEVLTIQKDIDSVKSVKNFLLQTAATAGIVIGFIYTMLKVTGQIS